MKLKTKQDKIRRIGEEIFKKQYIFLKSVAGAVLLKDWGQTLLDLLGVGVEVGLAPAFLHDDLQWSSKYCHLSAPHPVMKVENFRVGVDRPQCLFTMAGENHLFENY